MTRDTALKIVKALAEGRDRICTPISMTLMCPLCEDTADHRSNINHMHDCPIGRAKRYLRLRKGKK